jgi:hypothetical protein
MAKEKLTEGTNEMETLVAPLVAATLAGVIYQARLLNRQAKLNIPEQEVISDVVGLWHTVREAMNASPQ